MSRRLLDFYPTAKWAAETLWRLVPAIHSFAEPCVGRGALIPIFGEGPDVEWTNDIDPAMEAHNHFDACNPAVWSLLGPAEWVVTNPPFSDAHTILANALEHATDGVAFLLRLTFLEPVEKRGTFLEEHPPDRLIVLPRISFTGDGKTDSVTCAWMIWSRHVRPGIEVVDPFQRDQLTSEVLR